MKGLESKQMQKSDKTNRSCVVLSNSAFFGGGAI